MKGTIIGSTFHFLLDASLGSNTGTLIEMKKRKREREKIVQRFERMIVVVNWMTGGCNQTFILSPFFFELYGFLAQYIYSIIIMWVNVLQNMNSILMLKFFLQPSMYYFLKSL